MSSVHETVAAMWNSYLATLSEEERQNIKDYSSWYFCSDEKSANELAELVLSGTKRATASLHELYKHENEPLPAVGNLSIVTDWNGIAKCIIKTTSVEVVPFEDVTEEFARTEGEGDKSLIYWQKVHWSFFGEERRAIGKEPTDDMLVVCEEFEVVFK